jgi:peptidoglycan/xylan/chitin deacetylase (PgdA/CDA1 family)
MYHDLAADDDELTVWQAVRVSAFRRQLAYLREHYELVDLDHLVEIDRHDFRNDVSGRPLAVITFDDGLRGNAEWLLPIVEREQVPVTVYVATRHVETGEPNWCDRAVNALQGRHPVTIDLGAVGLGRFRVDAPGGPARWNQIQALLDAAKTRSAGNGPLLAELVESQAGRPVGRPALAPLTIAQVQELARSPYVTIGSHTHGHELLTLLDPTDARRTIVDSVERLERWTGQPVRHFCYPNGSVDARIAELVAELGFATATTVAKGIWRPGDSRFEIPRIPVSRFDSMDRFVAESLLGVGNIARQAATGLRRPRRSAAAGLGASAAPAHEPENAPRERERSCR